MRKVFIKPLTYLFNYIDSEFSNLFLKTMEFFRPKMSRVMGVVDNEMIIDVRHVESVKH